MVKTVEELQNAFQAMINKLKRNKKILTIFTFGSVVSGDVWEGSDIDLFIVYADEFNELRDLYSESLNVPVHMKILSKSSFLELYKNQEMNGFLITTLANSKLVYSKDIEISEEYNNARYMINSKVGKWNLVYFGKLIKEIGLCKKYLQTGGLNTSYEILVRALDSFAKLYINLNGYVVTKDALKMATNLNEEFRIIVEKLFYNVVDKECIKNTIEYLSKYADDNLINSSKLLLDFLSEGNRVISSYELMKHKEFKEFNINMEDILVELSKKNMILRQKQILKDSSGVRVFEENVYSANIAKKVR